MTAIYNQVVEILTSLGVNSTFYFQFAIFCFAYIAMSKIVFGPYLAAYEERHRRTVGGEKEAQDLQAQADETEAVYVKEARSLNDKIKEIYSEKAVLLNQDRNKILEEARGNAENKLNQGREQIEVAVGEARNTMKGHIQELSQQIQNKFSGN